MLISVGATAEQSSVDDQKTSSSVRRAVLHLLASSMWMWWKRS